jgi:hypothetical protein
MAAVAIAGIGMMMVCSSSLAAVMLMGGEEETPTTTTTTSAQSAAGPTGDEDDDTGDEDDDTGDEDDDTGDEDDDTGDDDSGGGGGGGVEYHWEVKNFNKITTGQPFKSINNASVNDCRNKCEKKNKCVGFNIGPIVGTKTCILYSGMDVRTEHDMNKNTHLLSRV